MHEDTTNHSTQYNEEKDEDYMPIDQFEMIVKETENLLQSSNKENLIKHVDESFVSNDDTFIHDHST
jgi:hypothetical protein